MIKRFILSTTYVFIVASEDVSKAIAKEINAANKNNVNLNEKYLFFFYEELYKVNIPKSAGAMAYVKQLS